MRGASFVNASVDLNTGMITLEDQWLGRRVIDGRPISTIRDQLAMLNKMRRDGRRPSRQLIDDIKVYKFILKQEDAEAAAAAYLTKSTELRDKYKTISVDKMLIARELGWVIK